MPIEVFQLPAFEDNYLFVIRDLATAQVAAIDPGDAEVISRFLDEQNWTLNFILNTHHHWDHSGGNLDLKSKYNCAIYGSEYDKDRIPGLDHTLKDGDTFSMGGSQASVFFTPGHTTGHIVYWFEDSGCLFCGDTLFSMGCGRLFEGTPEQMTNSLGKIKKLPEKTKIYCAHEYTENNLQFALSVENENPHLHKRSQIVSELRSKNQPTIPTTVKDELETNPFLRLDSPIIRKNLKMQNNPAAEILKKLRDLKDQF